MSNPKPIELVHKRADGLDIMMDVYVPENATKEQPAPVVLWWHGGGLLQGYRKVVAPHFLNALSEHNICFVSPDYRLAPQTRLPAILSDCSDAVRFLSSESFKSATNNRVDSSQLVLSGGSAGGWLALLVGMGVGFPESGLDPLPLGTVKGISSLYPITDIEDKFWTEKKRPHVGYIGRVIERSEVEPFIDPADEKAVYSTKESRRAIFYHYMVQEALEQSLLLDTTGIAPSAYSVALAIKTGRISAEAIPPTYIVHGDKDQRVPVRQSRDIDDAFKAVGFTKYFYDERPGLDHLFDFEEGEGMDRMYAFFDRVL